MSDDLLDELESADEWACWFTPPNDKMATSSDAPFRAAARIRELEAEVDALKSDLVFHRRGQMSEWKPIENAPREEGVLHVRGLWVFNSQTKKPLYWEAIAGYLSGDGEFSDHDGNAPWRADDYTHWMPLPEPPAQEKADEVDAD